VTTLRAALVTPLSGPLAPYGIGGATGLGLWAERAACLRVPWTRVALDVVDAYPSATAAMRGVMAQRPHVLFGPYGSGPAAVAFKATDQLVWNHGGATDRLCRPRFAHVVNVLAPASSYFAAVLQAVHTWDPTLHSVSLLHVATGFGHEVARGALQTAEALGMRLQACQFAPGESTTVAEQVPDADVLLVAGSFQDELGAARRLLSRRWRASAFVGAGVEEVLAPLGSEREGLLGPCQWLARAALPPEEGPDAAWFVHAYRDATGGDPAYPAAAAFAAGALCARCLREAGRADDSALLTAASRLSTKTLFGSFHLDPNTGLQAGHHVLVVQWQQGVRRVVWPPDRAERPLF
jgi:branched-chain amino acid transport system substrate-binding protein